MPAEVRFEIHPARGGGYFWHLKAANNEIVCSSQVYAAKESASDTVRWIKQNAGNAKVQDHTGQPTGDRG
jgi:uncharacterized protein YegP (UPF0339 family)